VETKTTSPGTGFAIPSLWKSVITGSRTPFVRLFTSSIAQPGGREPSSLIDTWPYVFRRMRKKAGKIKLLNMDFMAIDLG
jgi:hypothetical protein